MTEYKLTDIKDLESFLDTGWRCAVCFQLAQVKMIGVTLCVPHAKRYNFGYGDKLADMREEFDGRKIKQPGSITKAPNPQEYRIGKEVKKDYTTEGILKKHYEM